jgi:hypothetical protein
MRRQPFSSFLVHLQHSSFSSAALSGAVRALGRAILPKRVAVAQFSAFQSRRQGYMTKMTSSRRARKQTAPATIMAQGLPPDT